MPFTETFPELIAFLLMPWVLPSKCRGWCLPSALALLQKALIKIQRCVRATPFSSCLTQCIVASSSLSCQYYEVVLEAAFRSAALPDVGAWLVARAHRRYGLTSSSANVSAAWTALAQGAYASDGTLSDGTGVAMLPAPDTTHWSQDRMTPTPGLCSTWIAWGALIDASASVNRSSGGWGPFSYDLVNTGRETLAQLSSPLSQNLSAVLQAPGPVDAVALERTGPAYVALLLDLDSLLATHEAFLLGPWINSARSWGRESDDCNGSAVGDLSCPDFYTWNALCQLTTWYPTMVNASDVPHRDGDYARKHWSPLVSDYYAVRANLTLAQARKNAASRTPLDNAAVARANAILAYSFTTPPFHDFPLEPISDPVSISISLHAKYESYFTSCGQNS